MILQLRHNGCDRVSNHQPHDCLLNRLFRRISKKTPKLRVTGLCAGKSPGTGEIPAQRASYAENVSIWWRHYDFLRNIKTHPLPSFSRPYGQGLDASFSLILFLDKVYINASMPARQCSFLLIWRNCWSSAYEDGIYLRTLSNDAMNIELMQWRTGWQMCWLWNTIFDINANIFQNRQPNKKINEACILPYVYFNL